MILALQGSSSGRNTPFNMIPAPMPHRKEAVDRMYFPKYCNLILKKTNARGPEQPEGLGPQ